VATKTQKVKVGAFLLISAILIVGGLMLVAGYRQGNSQRYMVVFEKTVLGLYKGGMVQYLGVPVGVVDDIYVGNDGKAYIETLIDPDKVTLRHGVEAKLEFYSFATGTMCVALSGGDPTGEILPPGAIIPTGQSQLESVSSQAADLMASLNKIAEEIQVGMTGMEEGQLTEVVDQIKPFIDDARAFIEDARGTLKTVEEQLTTTIEDVKPEIKKFGDLADSAKELSKTANDTLGDMRAKIEPLDLAKLQTELLSLADQIKHTTKRLDGMSGTIPHTMDNLQYALVDTTRKLNETLDAFRELAETLNENPYVRGASPSEDAR